MKTYSILFVVVFVYSVRSVDSIKCILCNRSPECAREPSKVHDECVTTGEEKTCYTYLDGEYTKRDCTPPQGGCDDKKGCDSCEGEKCNNKIFPAERQVCYQCEGMQNCEKTSSLTSLPCTFYKEVDKCFTYVLDEKNIRRGCVSDKFDNCTSDSETCKICDDKQCNNQEIITKETCYDCKTSDGTSCIRSSTEANCKIVETIKTCTNDVLMGKKSYCYTGYDNNMLVRGCGLGKGESGLKTCDGKNCNNECIPDASCYVCDSKTDGSCKSTNLASYARNCSAFEILCNHCESPDGSQVKRICDGKPQTDLICKPCQGDKCNKDEKLPKMCYQCNSKDNPDCAKSENITPTFCSDSSHQCYVKLDDDGVTTRGCDASTTCDNLKETNCKSCKEHQCNTQILAKEPTRCFSCDGGGNCIGEQSGNATSCGRIDQCYMFSKSDETMKRGCLKDDNIPAECNDASSKCYVCAGDGCNSLPLKIKPGHECIQCSDAEFCPWRKPANNASACSNDMYYYQQELCYTLTLADKVERGCLSGNTNCTLQNRNCRVCYDRACNTESTKTFSCLRCRSDIYGQAACKNVDAITFASQCLQAPTADTIGCYIQNFGGVTIRGCLSDLEPSVYSQCTKNKFCDKCPEENCNKAKATSSSTVYRASTFIVLFMSVFVLKFLA